MKVTLNKAAEYVAEILEAGLVPYVSGSPGMGKSDMVRQISDQFNLETIDVRLSQLDPTVLNGFPFLKKGASEYDKATFVPMDLFPVKGDPLPEGKSGWLLFLDELPSAPSSVIKAAYKLILDKAVGDVPLHEKVFIVAAGNLITDRAQVTAMGTAMQSRLIHLEVEVCHDSWIAWADKTGIDHRIKSFINYRPELLHKFNPNHEDHTFLCPRTWSFLSALIKDKPILPAKMPLYQGTIGEGGAAQFVGYCEVYEDLVTFDEIVSQPTTAKVSNNPSAIYAVVGMIGEHIREDTIAQAMQYVERLPIEFQAVCLRSIIRKERSYLQNPAVKNWVSVNARELR